MYVETADGVIFQVSGMDLPDATMSLNDGQDESQLHTLEKSAYSAVLRAFCAQSNALSWGKEGLITELRKELRVSDVEHRQILAMVSTDKSIRLLRERRKDSNSDVVQEASLKNNDAIHVEPKRKMLQVVTRSAPAPITDHVTSRAQAQIANKAAPNLVIKNKKDCKVHDAGSSLSAKPSMHTPSAPVALVVEQMRYPASAPAPVLAPVPDPDPDSDPAPPPVRRASKPINRQPLSKKKCISDTIHIQKTDVLIQQIKEDCRNSNTNPAVVENAKQKLMDQEKALLEAINVLDDVSDSEEPPKKGRKKGHNRSRHHSMSSLCS